MHIRTASVCALVASLAACGTSGPNVDVTPVEHALAGESDPGVESIFNAIHTTLTAQEWLDLYKIDWSTITVAQFVNDPAAMHALELTAGAIDSAIAQALSSESSPNCTADEICYTVYDTMDVVFDKLPAAFAKYKPDNTTCLDRTDLNKSTRCVASVLLVNAVTTLRSKAGTYRDNFNQLTQCVPCVPPQTTRGVSSKPGSTTSGGGSGKKCVAETCIDPTNGNCKNGFLLGCDCFGTVEDATAEYNNLKMFNETQGLPRVASQIDRCDTQSTTLGTVCCLVSNQPQPGETCECTVVFMGDCASNASLISQYGTPKATCP